MNANELKIIEIVLETMRIFLSLFMPRIKNRIDIGIIIIETKTPVECANIKFSI